ncbi:hypothetical protein CGMCC3_g13919 [Colletotrichum fructicola]|nr:uncharacterized protein CGMCC3_g13919 [Colletotrichum fructicola]KAE9569978.1 hypothetical protein CGMCC3_g13919 [Colletotrichum fructicola]KAF4434414.1 hypothetical protein CFRS1_v014094 [Colletotrichum fructicola]KAF4882480.1 hypothetical protein CGCFRS4_v014511 [Colletotrichum fructicola]
MSSATSTALTTICPQAVSSSPHRDTLYLDEDDGGDVDLTLSPCRCPALPPHLPAKLGRPWLRYIASLVLLVALVWLSVWVLLPVFQRPLGFAIPVTAPSTTTISSRPTIHST